MSDVGLYALTKIVVGGLSAFMTGPLGSIDIPDVDIQRDIIERPTGYSAQVVDHTGAGLGYAGHGKGTSPAIADLPDHFIQALLSVEDARFGAHPGIDPMAVASAGIDTLRGYRRGGSTITQQLVKNSVTGDDLTFERKIKEAIVSVRMSEAYDPAVILQAYLANVWFGRGQEGVSGASMAWFGKPWADIELHEAAFLAGILKGPAYYDPVKYPERATQRRNVVLDMMLERRMITAEECAEAKEHPLSVIPAADSNALLDSLSPWIASAVQSDFNRYDILSSSTRVSGDMVIQTTIDPEWQEIAETALRDTIDAIGGKGPAGTVELGSLSFNDPLDSPNVERVRAGAADMLATSHNAGRVIIESVTSSSYQVLLDRGYGPLEWVRIGKSSSHPGYTPKRGDVLPYTRVDGQPVLSSVPQLQGAVVIMAPESGAVLASVGGYDPEVSPFDRTQAKRQPGSAIKPFLWLQAMQEGMSYNTLVEDLEMVYTSANGEIWKPRNYDGSQSGYIPLFVALEESSNLVAANLAARIGIPSLASMTESIGVYEKDGMRRHMTSALGASEATLTRMTAGYAAIANGGHVVAPHHIATIEKDGTTIWDPRYVAPDMAVAEFQNAADVSSMLYGVTQRGTAAGAFRGSIMKVAGKTGTTQDYRDAWFMSYVPGIAVGVWIGRDDFKPIRGNRSGASAAAPVARKIYDTAAMHGLLSSHGARIDQGYIPQWPPVLLSAGYRATAVQPDPREPFKRPVETSYLEEPTRVLSTGPAWEEADVTPEHQSDIFDETGDVFPDDTQGTGSSYLDGDGRNAGMMVKTPW
jgi:penicillin-binding protein 1A